MKKYIIILLGMLLPLSTYAQQNKNSDWPNILEQVTGNRTYKIEITRVIPRIGQSSTPTSPYYLEVKGDTLISYLPYIGRVTNVAYGGGDGLNFTAPIKRYETVVKNNNKLRVTFRAKSRDDSFMYTLTIFENGKTSITVQGINREAISFNGDFILQENK